MKQRNKNLKGRATDSARAARTRIESRGMIEEIGADRRADVYRTNAEFASEPEKRQPRPEVRGDWRWIEPISQRYARGMSQLDIAIDLDIALGRVGKIIREHGIKKGCKER
jgi:hypothetical protein